MSSTTDAYAARQPYEEFTLSADRGELRPTKKAKQLLGIAGDRRRQLDDCFRTG